MGCAVRGREVGWRRLVTFVPTCGVPVIQLRTTHAQTSRVQHMLLRTTHLAPSHNRAHSSLIGSHLLPPSVAINSQHVQVLYP